jgi:hypothetical protein
MKIKTIHLGQEKYTTPAIQCSYMQATRSDVTEYKKDQRYKIKHVIVNL